MNTGEAVVFISLGSNVGNRAQNLRTGRAKLEAAGVRITAASLLYETEPQDILDQPWFLNQVIQAQTRQTPHELLAMLQQIEQQMGRIRTGSPPRGPRLIDLDILLYGDESFADPELVIPHSRMLHRRFVLQPLLEIAPDLKDKKGCSLRDYLARTAAQRLRIYTESD